MKQLTASDVPRLFSELRAGNRASLGRAITLLESSRPQDRALAESLLALALSHRGASYRIGLTGPPGVGKSTFIEALGSMLCDAGHRVAVLAIDPSSTVRGGSVLGDKTRMIELTRNPNAFIRPSPTRGALGGVAASTRESMLLCECAGYDLIIVETVGVGQSEIDVASMVDFFLVLVLPGGGDQLQGIKRGVLELADLVAVTKADGARVAEAERARAQYAQALRLMPPRTPAWVPPVLTVSATSGEGLTAIWAHMEDFRGIMQTSGQWQSRRDTQRVAWMWSAVERGLREHLHADRRLAGQIQELERDVRGARKSPESAAAEILRTFFQAQKTSDFDAR